MTRSLTGSPVESSRCTICKSKSFLADLKAHADHQLNVDVTQHIAELSITHGFSLVYISTDYVFDGSAPGSGYQPSDVVGPTNLYGVTKEAGEQVVSAGLARGGKGVILRVPVL